MIGLVDRFVEQVIANSGFEEMDAFTCAIGFQPQWGIRYWRLETELEELIELKDELFGSWSSIVLCQRVAGRTGYGWGLFDGFDDPKSKSGQRNFWQTYQNSPDQAISDFYELSKRNDYIKMAI